MSNERRLITQSRNFNRSIRIEIVTVIIAPLKKVHKCRDARKDQPLKPSDHVSSDPRIGCRQAQYNNQQKTPRNEFKLGKFGGLNFLHPDIMIENIDLIHI